MLLVLHIHAAALSRKCQKSLSLIEDSFYLVKPEIFYASEELIDLQIRGNRATPIYN